MAALRAVLGDCPPDEEGEGLRRGNPPVCIRSWYDRLYLHPFEDLVDGREMWSCVILHIFPIVIEGHGDLIGIVTHNHLGLD